MDTITIEDLELFTRVGVPDQERAMPQRLLVSLEMGLDLAPAAATDDLTRTIDYFAVSRRLIELGTTRSWKLIETLAEDVSRIVLDEFGPREVRVTVKKFILPEARWVSVRVSRSRS